MSVRGGGGRVLDIVGEPGIGKSRLLEELRIRAGDLRGLQVTCEAYTAAVPHAASRQLLHQVLRTPLDANAALMEARLRAAVTAGEPALEPWLPLLAIPFGLNLEPTQQVAHLDGEFRRAKLHEVVVAFLRSTLEAPTLIEVEDAHHVDPASADLLAAVAAAAPDAPWLLAVTRRDAGPGVATHAAVERIEPEPLTSAETMDLARDATARVPLPPRMLEVVAERSGGNPQFLRDLLRSAAQDGAEHLPESIEAAAAARLDHLPPADRALVRRAAVLGRAFDPARSPSCSTRTLNRRTRRPGPGCTDTSSPTGSGSCASGDRSCGRRRMPGFRSASAAASTSAPGSSWSGAAATTPCWRCTSSAPAITSARSATRAGPRTLRCGTWHLPRRPWRTGAPSRRGGCWACRQARARRCGRRWATPMRSSASSPRVIMPSPPPDGSPPTSRSAGRS